METAPSLRFRRVIRRFEQADLEAVYRIINDAATAYRGVIPEECWGEPYMSRDELAQEIATGVEFWILERDGEPVGVMGAQDKRELTLIRHAYVRGCNQRRGIGSRLLAHLERRTPGPWLVGTWTDAGWAIRFYERRGYRRLSAAESARLLRAYWSIPARQLQASVVLAKDRVRSEAEA